MNTTVIAAVAVAAIAVAGVGAVVLLGGSSGNDSRDTITVTCVMVANVVGIVMIMALMTITAAMGNLFSKNLNGTMALGTLFAVCLSIFGLFLSLAMNTPPGATVVLAVGAVFVVMLLLKRALRNAGQ